MADDKDGKAGGASSKAGEDAKEKIAAKSEPAKAVSQKSEAAKPASEKTEAAKPASEKTAAAKSDAAEKEKEKEKKASPWPSAHKSETPSASEPKETPKKQPQTSAAKGDGAAWGEPFVRFDVRWTKLEARLCFWVLVLEISALVFTVAMNCLSTGTAANAKSGVLFRGLLTAIALGTAAHLATRKSKNHAAITTFAVIAGAMLGRTWGDVGVLYFTNLRNWIQGSSLLMLAGGVSNLAKRLTILLALLGASLATAQGKHINLDVAMRFLPAKRRVPVAILGWLGASLVCFAAVWGFFDQIAIEDFKIAAEVRCPDDPQKACAVSPSEKLDKMTHEIRRDLFLMGRQMSLDLKSFPKVIVGEKYDGYFTGRDWNAWLDEAEWKTWFSASDVDAMKAPDDALDTPRVPAIAVPGGSENVTELLLHELDLVFPFGLFMIALRFLLRCVLAASGHAKVDPGAAHSEEDFDDKDGADPEPEPAKGGA